MDLFTQRIIDSWFSSLERRTIQRHFADFDYFSFAHSDGNDLQHRPIQTFSHLKPNDLLHFPPSYEFKETKQFLTQKTQTFTSAGFHDSEELINFFKQKEFSFVTLRTPNKEFVVHKAVLCSKSPVFNAMFERNMIENDTNSVHIDDIESETVSLLIKFLHFEPLGTLHWEDVTKLYYAADKYQIEGLKKFCRSFLETVLSLENVLDLFILADKHQDKNIMSCAEKYFRLNFEKILISAEWQRFLRSNYQLATRIGNEIQSPN
nr:speckle-type POZ protein [Parasteatoda tepidariorum]